MGPWSQRLVADRLSAPHPTLFKTDDMRTYIFSTSLQRTQIRRAPPSGEPKSLTTLMRRERG
ncbi:hypothetical protein FHS54_001321 [Sphingobium vermicomposti]|uniref:Uncharacterized protein n=1 Tax=Sphingobium vermicomposti TaxID=529005 RepID=A0A846MEV8_9SPHN|nr:hypothetical protein [Sphingobium vermicomposti]